MLSILLMILTLGAIDTGTGASSVVTSDVEGSYQVAAPGGTRVTPRMSGNSCSGISALDASWILQYMVGKRELNEFQLLACDVTGNGSCSSLDAAKILAFTVKNIDRLPSGELCNSDWLFVPVPFPVLGVAIEKTNPSFSEEGCVMGSVRYTDPILPLLINGQDFTGILSGDVTGSWQPCGD